MSEPVVVGGNHATLFVVRYSHACHEQKNALVSAADLFQVFLKHTVLHDVNGKISCFCIESDNRLVQMGSGMWVTVAHGSVEAWAGMDLSQRTPTTFEDLIRYSLLSGGKGRVAFAEKYDPRNLLHVVIAEDIKSASEVTSS